MNTPKIVQIEDRKLLGMRTINSLATDKTFELWRAFKPKTKALPFKQEVGYYSLQQYAKGFNMRDFTPLTEFEKWAAVEVENYETIPDDLEKYTLPGGTYAVFIHIGTPAMFAKTAQFIYGEWIPKSGYQLDDRPHFEIITETYRPDDPKAEEEVWIPIRVE